MTPPDVRVVRGEPDDDELAALVAGLAAGSAAGRDHHPVADDEAAGAGRRRWRAAVHPGQEPLRPGHDAWRWSTRH